MRRFTFAGLLMAAGAVSVVGLAQGPDKPPVAEVKGVKPEPAKPDAVKPVVGTWEVRYTDDSTMKLTLMEESLTFVTPHGTLQIPVRDIKKIEFGTRLSDEDQKLAETAVAALTGTDNAKREAAKDALAEMGVKVLPFLQRMAKQAPAEAKPHFTFVSDKLIVRLPDRKAVPRDYDVIHTDESSIAGRVGTVVLRVDTFQFGEQKLKVTAVKTMQFGKLAVAVAAENLEIVDANTLTQIALRRVGQTVGVRVTGAAGGTVWGTKDGPITSDSSIAAAAVYYGILKVGETGVVRIRFVPSPLAYEGDPNGQNGVMLSPYGQYTSGSYEIVKQP